MDPDSTAPATVGDLKSEIALLRTELKGEMAELRTELKGEMAELRTELKGDMAELRTELKGEMAELRTELKGDMAELEVRLHDRITRSVANDMAALEDRITRSVALEIGRSVNVMMEHMTSLIRGAGDETRAVAERGRATEARLEAHVADASIHRRPRR